MMWKVIVSFEQSTELPFVCWHRNPNTNQRRSRYIRFDPYIRFVRYICFVRYIRFVGYIRFDPYISFGRYVRFDQHICFTLTLQR